MSQDELGGGAGENSGFGWRTLASLAIGIALSLFVEQLLGELQNVSEGGLPEALIRVANALVILFALFHVLLGHYQFGLPFLTEDGPRSEETPRNEARIPAAFFVFVGATPLLAYVLLRFHADSLISTFLMMIILLVYLSITKYSLPSFRDYPSDSNDKKLEKLVRLSTLIRASNSITFSYAMMLFVLSVLYYAGFIISAVLIVLKKKGIAFETIENPQRFAEIWELVISGVFAGTVGLYFLKRRFERPRLVAMLAGVFLYILRTDLREEDFEPHSNLDDRPDVARVRGHMKWTLIITKWLFLFAVFIVFFGYIAMAVLFWLNRLPEQLHVVAFARVSLAIVLLASILCRIVARFLDWKDVRDFLQLKNNEVTLKPATIFDRKLVVTRNDIKWG